MDLILWRHADAEDGVRDEERSLTTLGRKQARDMAAWLKRRLPRGTRILVSPTQRTQQTARALAARIRVSEDVGLEATPQSVLKAASWPRGAGTVLVVGHQPTLGRAAALALTGAPDDWGFPKGAIWWLSSRDGDDAAVRAVITPDLL